MLILFITPSISGSRDAAVLQTQTQWETDQAFTVNKIDTLTSQSQTKRMHNRVVREAFIDHGNHKLASS